MIGKPVADRTYVIMFRNTGRSVKTVDKVTVVLGEMKAENLVAQ